MKKNIHLLIVLAILAGIAIACDHLNKKIVEKFDNGKPRKVQYFDKKNQLVREVEYYPSGKKHFDGEYTNGKRNGKWIFWFENGKTWSEGYFKEGVRNGIAKVYHENGELFYTGAYIDGKKDGTWTFYGPDGKRSNEIRFDKGIFQNQSNASADSLPK